MAVNEVILCPGFYGSVYGNFFVPLPERWIASFQSLKSNGVGSSWGKVCRTEISENSKVTKSLIVQPSYLTMLETCSRLWNRWTSMLRRPGPCHDTPGGRTLTWETCHILEPLSIDFDHELWSLPNMCLPAPTGFETTLLQRTTSHNWYRTTQGDYQKDPLIIGWHGNPCTWVIRGGVYTTYMCGHYLFQYSALVVQPSKLMTIHRINLPMNCDVIGHKNSNNHKFF